MNLEKEKKSSEKYEVKLPDRGSHHVSYKNKGTSLEGSGRYTEKLIAQKMASEERVARLKKRYRLATFIITLIFMFLNRDASIEKIKLFFEWASTFSK